MTWKRLADLVIMITFWLHLPLMLSKRYKILVWLMFMVVFSLKMAISVAPLFLSLNNKAVNSVITQLELDGKTDKDNADKENPEKEIIKDKKFFDENMVYASVFITILTETNVLHNQEQSLYIQQHHPIVPTPPPNA